METEPDEEAASPIKPGSAVTQEMISRSESSEDTSAASNQSASNGTVSSGSSQDEADGSNDNQPTMSSSKSLSAESMAVDETNSSANVADVKPVVEALVSSSGPGIAAAATISSDSKFDPPVEMLVDDEEEPPEPPKEATMSPFCSRSLSPSPTVSPEVLVQGNDNSQSSSGSEEILPDQALPMEKVDVGADFNDDEKPKPSTLHHMDADPLELDEPTEVQRRQTTRLRRTVVRQPTNSEDDFFSDEDEDEEEEEEEEEMRKTIMIGGSYQAVVPEGLCKYGDSKPYKNADKLLWDPKGMSDESIEKYLVSTREAIESGAQGIDVLPMGAHTRDDEQALYLLLQCSHNVDEALKKWSTNPPSPPSASQLWTDEECRNFENGLLMFGKDFHAIQAQKVRTRSVAELVQFYYLWKKTERHDIFANKMRPDKKKYMLHPGITLLVFEMLEKENNKEAAAKDAHVTV